MPREKFQISNISNTHKALPVHHTNRLKKCLPSAGLGGRYRRTMVGGCLRKYLAFACLDPGECMDSPKRAQGQVVRCNTIKTECGMKWRHVICLDPWRRPQEHLPRLTGARLYVPPTCDKLIWYPCPLWSEKALWLVFALLRYMCHINSAS